MTPYPRHRIHETLAAAVCRIGVDPVATGANDCGAHVVLIVWHHADDLDRVNATISQICRRTVTSDLYGPPRYARGSTDGRHEP